MLKKDAVYRRLRDDIANGLLSAGEVLPGEEKLALLHKVSRVTLRAALARLESEGFIDRVDSKGTFVSDKFRSKIYLVLTSGITHPASPLPFLLAGLENALREAGCSVDFCSTVFLDGQTPEAILEHFARFSGIFSLCSFWSGSEALLKALNSFSNPVVHLAASDTDLEQITNGALMYLDVRAAFRSALEYLRRLGHRRVAVCAAMSDVWNLRGYSEEEYKALLNEIGLDMSEELWHFFPLTPDNARRHLAELLRLPAPPTAIMCYSDYWAFGIASALRELGVPVPAKLSVMGFSAFPGGQFTSPPLSTVDFGLQERGESAVRLMLDSPAWFRPGQRVVKPFPAKLIIRQSTAAPGAPSRSVRHGEQPQYI